MRCLEDHRQKDKKVIERKKNTSKYILICAIDYFFVDSKIYYNFRNI